MQLEAEQKIILFKMIKDFLHAFEIEEALDNIWNLEESKFYFVKNKLDFHFGKIYLKVYYKFPEFHAEINEDILSVRFPELWKNDRIYFVIGNRLDLESKLSTIYLHEVFFEEFNNNSTGYPKTTVEIKKMMEQINNEFLPLINKINLTFK